MSNIVENSFIMYIQLYIFNYIYIYIQLYKVAACDLKLNLPVHLKFWIYLSWVYQRCFILSQELNCIHCCFIYNNQKLETN